MKPIKESDKELHLRICAMQSVYYEELKVLLCGANNYQDFTHADTVNRLKDLMSLAEHEKWIQDNRQADELRGDYNGY